MWCAYYNMSYLIFIVNGFICTDNQIVRNRLIMFVDLNIALGAHKTTHSLYTQVIILVLSSVTAKYLLQRWRLLECGYCMYHFLLKKGRRCTGPAYFVYNSSWWSQCWAMWLLSYSYSTNSFAWGALLCSKRYFIGIQTIELCPGMVYIYTYICIWHNIFCVTFSECGSYSLMHVYA